MKIIRKFGKEERGQSLVEFALVLPVMLLLIVAIVDYGWLFSAKLVINNAAREGARYYSVKDNAGEAISAANGAMSHISSGFTVTTDKNDGKAHVKVSGSVEPLVGLFLPNRVPLSSEAYMRIEY